MQVAEEAHRASIGTKRSVSTAGCGGFASLLIGWTGVPFSSSERKCLPSSANDPGLSRARIVFGTAFRCDEDRPRGQVQRALFDSASQLHLQRRRKSCRVELDGERRRVFDEANPFLQRLGDFLDGSTCTQDCQPVVAGRRSSRRPTVVAIRR